MLKNANIKKVRKSVIITPVIIIKKYQTQKRKMGLYQTNGFELKLATAAAKRQEFKHQQSNSSCW